MGLKIVLSALASRKRRQEITKGKPRQINPAGTIVRKENGGMLDVLLGWGKRIVGFVVSLLPVVGGWATTVWSWLIGAATAIVNFDWNASDKQIEEWIKGNNIALASTWGNAVGEIAGSVAALAIGAGVSLLVPVIGGKALAAIVKSRLIAERADDVIGALRSALQATVGTMAKNSGLSLYVNIRKAIRLIPAFKGWGREGGKPFIIAEKVEEAIQAIPNEYLRAFTDSAVDQFFESFVESGYIVANTIDEQWQLHKASATTILGKETTLEIYPDPEIKEEKIVLKGNQRLLKPQLSTVLANAQIIKNKDVGQIAGMPASEFVSAVPTMRSLTIILYSKEKPPFFDRKTKKRAKPVQVSIPDYKKGLTWQQIKDACKNHTWGKFHGIAKLDNGRTIEAWSSSEKEAVEKVKDYCKLSEAEIVSIRVTEQKETKNLSMKREPTRIYPVFVNFTVRKKASKSGKGRRTLTGNLEEKRERWELWRDKQPQGYKTP
ncbi:hypothetical protein [Pseudanabaena sp. PCC 6802]|uniref:hypothetical protein n=1 Tax=Pseudanabaena sp. PCC 6802 TaxID=118173 RepID=UPI00034D9BC5|nr:hypothetical protein [Pseudanabaena sp. PCC 6802]